MGAGRLSNIKVPTKPKLDFDSDTFYFDSKFTQMTLNKEVDFIHEVCMSRDTSPTSTSTQSSYLGLAPKFETIIHCS
jgi:alanine-alpha-ketoisovalerate/valine-pyruvate aminotransferase